MLDFSNHTADLYQFSYNWSSSLDEKFNSKIFTDPGKETDERGRQYFELDL